MEAYDLQAFCAPLPGDKPAGENLEYDQRFLDLATLAAGKAQQQMGEAVIEAEAPDWPKLRAACLELTPATRDLRILIYLTLAELALEGIPGYAAGLERIDNLCGNLWESFYPQPDEDDPSDLLERMNCLIWLSPAPGSFGDDPLNFPARLRETVLLQTRAAGKVTLRDLLVISGDLQLPEEATRPDEAQVNAVFQDAGTEAVGAAKDALTKAAELYAHLEATVIEKAGSAQVPDLSQMRNLLKKGLELVKQRWQAMTGAEDADDAAEAADPDGDGTGGAPAGPGKIRGREDVRKALDKIIGYYQMNEPGSPVPFLLKRALKMVDMNFVDLMNELTPESLDKLTVVMGREIAPPPES